MKAYLLIDLIIFVNIYCVVWAQTSNNETATQMPGNTEPLVLEMTQTPKTGDNQTEYERITTTSQTNDLDSNNRNPIDLVSMNKTFIVTTVTESNTQAMENETTLPTNPINSSSEQENQTIAIDSGNSSSKSFEINEGEEHQTTDSLTTHPSILGANEGNDSTVTPQLLITNITSMFPGPLEKSSKAFNLSDYSNDETNDSSNSISDVNNETIVKTSNITEESYSSSTESNAIYSLNGDNTTKDQHISNSTQSPIISSSPELRETTQFNEINSSQTTETSTQKAPSDDITQGIRITNINTFVDYSSEHKTEDSIQITENPNNSTESQTNPNHYYISEMSGNPIDQNQQNQTQYPEIAEHSNWNTSETSSTPKVESVIQSQTLQVQTIGKLSTISTLPDIQNITNSVETIQTNEQKSKETTETIPQTESDSPITTTATTTTTIVSSTHSFRQTSESQRQSKSESMERQTKPLIELLETNISTIDAKPTQFESQSTLTLNSTEATVNEKLEASPTQHSQSSEVQTESQMTESSIGVLAANDSDPSIDSQTTFKQPLTDHSFKTTQYIKPMTTSIPLESNISAITLTLPNIKYISSINKEDMVNIVTITFVAKSIDIFRWVSIYDLMFRNFTCDRIDSERNWCSIDRFVYLSPSPLVVNNHLILNFLIDDSTDNGLNTFHVFAGPLIVEALKNSTNSLEAMMSMKVMSLQTNLGTMVVKPLDNSPERLAKFELLVFIFTVVMFICTALLCLAVICSCAKRKSVDMNQIHLSNAGRRQTNGGFDLNSASNILRDENQENKLNHNVINLDGWVAPIDQVESEKITKYDNLQDTKL